MTEHNELAGLTTAQRTLAPLEVAFLETAEERAALSVGEVRQVNLDLPEAVQIALAAVGRIERLIVSLSEGAIDLELVRRVALYARAAAHAHARFGIALKPPTGLDATYREAIEARKMLRLDAQNLMFHRLIDPRRLARLRWRMGHRNVAYELMGLVEIYRSLDSTVRARSALTQEQLDRAEVTGTNLLVLSAERSLEQRLRADDDRRRAFTLLHRAYEELRRMLAFARWYKRDLAQIAPALHTAPGAGRRKTQRKRTVDQHSVVESTTTNPVAAPPAVVQQVTPLAPADALPGVALVFGLLADKES